MVRNGPKRPYNGPKRPYNGPKGLKMHEKRQKNRVFRPKKPAF